MKLDKDHCASFHKEENMYMYLSFELVSVTRLYFALDVTNSQCLSSSLTVSHARANVTDHSLQALRVQISFGILENAKSLYKCFLRAGRMLKRI